MMRKNEGITVNSTHLEAFQALLVDKVQITVQPLTRAPGMPRSGNAYPYIKDYFENQVFDATGAYSIPMFTNKVASKKFLDTAAIDCSWFISNQDFTTATPVWCERINPLLTKRYTTQSDLLPLSVRFYAYGVELARYDGTVNIGIHYRIKELAYGLSLEIKLDKSFVSNISSIHHAEEPVNRFANLDYEAKQRYEASRRLIVPDFTAIELIRRDGTDVIFDRRGNLNTASFTNLFLTVDKGVLLSGYLKHERAPVEQYCKRYQATTRASFESMAIMEGSTVRVTTAQDLYQQVKKQLDRIESYDNLVTVEFNFSNILTFKDGYGYSQEGVLQFYYQRANIIAAKVVSLQLVRTVRGHGHRDLDYREPATVSPRDITVNPRFALLDLETFVRSSRKKLDYQRSFATTAKLTGTMSTAKMTGMKARVTDFENFLGVLKKDFLEDVSDPNSKLSGATAPFFPRLIDGKPPVELNFFAQSTEAVWKEFKAGISSLAKEDELAWELTLGIVLTYGTGKTMVAVTYKGELVCRIDGYYALKLQRE